MAMAWSCLLISSTKVLSCVLHVFYDLVQVNGYALELSIDQQHQGAELCTAYIP